MFQHTAARRRLLTIFPLIFALSQFQHTAARRRLPYSRGNVDRFVLVSTHSRPKAAATRLKQSAASSNVSTHSRPKAAAIEDSFTIIDADGFNTQPPEGGCLQWYVAEQHEEEDGFNTQPPEGGCSLYKKVRKISRLNTVFR